jgi:hypothetical protein
MPTWFDRQSIIPSGSPHAGTACTRPNKLYVDFSSMDTGSTIYLSVVSATQSHNPAETMVENAMFWLFNPLTYHP